MSDGTSGSDGSSINNPGDQLSPESLEKLAHLIGTTYLFYIRQLAQPGSTEDQANAMWEIVVQNAKEPFATRLRRAWDIIHVSANEDSYRIPDNAAMMLGFDLQLARVSNFAAREILRGVLLLDGTRGDLNSRQITSARMTASLEKIEGIFTDVDGNFDPSLDDVFMALAEGRL